MTKHDLYNYSGAHPMPPELIGKTIIQATLNDSEIRLTFDDGTGIVIEDNGQSCCESRYITTDDDLHLIQGGQLLAIEVKDGPDAEDQPYEVHETQFLEIQTSVGFVQFVTHNEHNGYYGGFILDLKIV